jgi:NAD(P)-dependent dehydrogenase (short-subunit alcohol dehydrogenase family)
MNEWIPFKFYGKDFSKLITKLFKEFRIFLCQRHELRNPSAHLQQLTSTAVSMCALVLPESSFRILLEPPKRKHSWPEELLSGKTCIVTGSTAGIGKGIAKKLLSQGAYVFINGRNELTVQNVLTQFAEEGLTSAQGIVADISTTEGCESFFTQVAATGRPIDVLINNMGIFETCDFFDITDEKWSQYFNVNVMSTVRFCRQYLRQMLDRNQGRIIIVSSECGLRPIGDMIHYAMTKSAQINIARGLSELTKGTNVTVNSLLPGPTATEGLTEFVKGIAEQSGKNEEEAVKDYFKVREPTSLLQRFLTVDEVANVAMFLASDLSSGINGTSQRVEGGIIRSI